MTGVQLRVSNCWTFLLPRSHAAAEALGKPIVALDAALQGIHIAFEAWVSYKSQSHEERYTNWDIGYTRLAGRWGIALRVVNGDLSDPEDVRVERWHFNESPLYLWHSSIDKLPELLEALATTGSTVAGKLTRAAARAADVAQAVSPPQKAKK